MYILYIIMYNCIKLRLSNGMIGNFIGIEINLDWLNMSFVLICVVVCLSPPYRLIPTSGTLHPTPPHTHTIPLGFSLGPCRPYPNLGYTPPHTLCPARTGCYSHPAHLDLIHGIHTYSFLGTPHPILTHRLSRT